jgi:TRAP-type C4-dicarboxylate transport system permease small subunit
MDYIMGSYEKIVTWLARSINWLAAIAIMVMMLLTTADVILRYFRHPIPGTYEIVGFLGSIGVGFALASTSMQNGHVAVSVLLQRLSRKTQSVVEAVNSLLAAGFFSLVTWQSVVLGNDLRRTGEVSLTLEMPFYPFVYGIAVGCATLTLVLILDFLASTARFGKR